MESIKEAKEYLRKNWEKGVKCPCCGQMVKLYKRRITSAMAYGLILICRGVKPNQSIHLLKYFTDKKVSASVVSNIPLFQHWGLLIKDRSEKEDGNPDCGVYIITQKAFDFVQGKINLPKYVRLYNKILVKSIEANDGYINIHDALGNKFNYDELMKGL